MAVKQKTGEYRKCLSCEQFIYLKPCQAKSGRKKYCSKECLYKGNCYINLFQKGHPDLVPKESRGHTLETRIKISKAQHGKVKNYTYPWKYGVSKIDKLVRAMVDYKIWRKKVFKRDGYRCLDCGAKGYVTAHHIISFSSILRSNNIQDIEDARKVPLLWDVSNGKTLCELCHSLTDNYKGRAKKLNALKV